MKVIPTTLPGAYIIEAQVFTDERGFFFESYHAEKLASQGINTVFRQDNHSRSVKGTLRGLHFQRGPAAQTKLVRCTLGEIYDVIVDVRPNSSTYGAWEGFTLTAENKKQVYVPQGFAHGFLVRSEIAEVQYKCDNFYSPKDEQGIIWNDPDLNISWGFQDPIVSAKDKILPKFSQISL
jgi:dTDP-4-dehydrorhamnose 3,5-epimerase